MNMPVDNNGTVHFSTTLFALVREALSIRMGPGNEFYICSLPLLLYSSTKMLFL